MRLERNRDFKAETIIIIIILQVKKYYYYFTSQSVIFQFLGKRASYVVFLLSSIYNITIFCNRYIFIIENLNNVDDARRFLSHESG